MILDARTTSLILLDGRATSLMIVDAPAMLFIYDTQGHVAMTVVEKQSSRIFVLKL